MIHMHEVSLGDEGGFAEEAARLGNFVFAILHFQCELVIRRVLRRFGQHAS